MIRREVLGKVIYGAAFCIALPALLAAWSYRLERYVSLPMPPYEIGVSVGIFLCVAGGLLWLWGVASLWHFGQGLPMNAYPPVRGVSLGAFAWVNHPIYVGFVMAALGVAFVSGSGAGVWIVVPVAALGCCALVLGYENAAIVARYPGLVRRPMVRLPDEPAAGACGVPPTLRDRAAVYVLVYGAWLAAYLAVGHLPVPDAISPNGDWERRLPVVPAWEIVYASVYAAVLCTPMVIRDARVLRRHAIDGLVAIAFVHLIYLAVPVVVAPRLPSRDGFWAGLLELERADGLAGRAACPSFHVVWAALSAHALMPRRGIGVWAALGWVLLVMISCVATGMHGLVDVIAGLLAGLGVVHRTLVYGSVLRAAEWLANAWREWRVGPVRVISYALIAAVAAAVGVAIMVGVAGSALAGWIVGGAMAGLVGAGLWGRFWVATVGGVGTSTMRPFGYFGSVLGCSGALALAGVVRGTSDAWVLLGAAALAAPWIQALGRVRCLTNGCCHGKPCDSQIGIRYTHERSRVVRLSKLAGIPVHPTPVYSIISNLIIGALLWRLWHVGAPPHLICGGYCVLGGLTRFVEESYRGEPHTPVYGGLRLYQWCASGLVAAGVVVSSLSCDARFGAFAWTLPGALWALAVAVVYAFAMGVDFPQSERPLSRLA